jgi:hypothetical protein
MTADFLLAFNTVMLLAGLLGLLVWSVRWWLRQPPTTYWEEYTEQLDRDRAWWACQEGPGCDWPENCSPGDCRRPRS